MTPEARARQTIDTLLTAADWHVYDVANANIHAGGGAVKGVAIREFPLNAGHGFADYLLYVNGKACGVIEAKKEGTTLSGVEVQSARYAQGLPAALPAWRRPLPFVFESTGVETRFTNGLDPAPRARPLFAFFRPESSSKLSSEPRKKTWARFSDSPEEHQFGSAAGGGSAYAATCRDAANC